MNEVDSLRGRIPRAVLRLHAPEAASETVLATEAGSAFQAKTVARPFLAASAAIARLDEINVEELILAVNVFAVSTLARTVQWPRGPYHSRSWLVCYARRPRTGSFRHASGSS